MESDQKTSHPKQTCSDVEALNADTPEPLPESYSANQDPQTFYKLVDRIYQANLAKFTMGISPAGIRTAIFAWFSQSLQSPGCLLELVLFVPLHYSELLKRLLSNEIIAEGQDVRFQSPNWQYMPWRLWAECFKLTEHWCQRATDLPGLATHTQRILSFMVRQHLDAISPANFIGTNPDLYQETVRSLGMNLVRGSEIAMVDTWEHITGSPPSGIENFAPGKHVAITPGRVVFRNHLIELLQYEPQTKLVYKEPVLIVPAWIMKYYILDLSPNNSLVRWLVSQGHTVYIISWRNPTSKDRSLSMDDYYRLGAIAAIDKVCCIQPKTQIHLMGYCLGGTLAMITSAAMARDEDNRLKSLTLLAAQGDFTEAGELMLFINKSELTFLENMMWEKGYLDTKQMAGSFQMLRSYDMIWSKMIQDYMHGEQRGMVDLMAWNADATRMPYKMHSEYLEKLFLNNDLSGGRFRVEGRSIAIENIEIPTFIVSTEKDHVAPWKSVYKLNLMLNNELVFVLTNGGHNAGMLSEPGRPGRSYHITRRKTRSRFLSPDDWLETAEFHPEASWWIAWHDWLSEHATGSIPATPLESKLPPAPGKYIFQK